MQQIGRGYETILRNVREYVRSSERNANRVLETPGLRTTAFLLYAHTVIEAFRQLPELLSVSMRVDHDNIRDADQFELSARNVFFALAGRHGRVLEPAAAGLRQDVTPSELIGTGAYTVERDHLCVAHALQHAGGANPAHRSRLVESLAAELDAHLPLPAKAGRTPLVAPGAPHSAMSLTDQLDRSTVQLLQRYRRRRP